MSLLVSYFIKINLLLSIAAVLLLTATYIFRTKKTKVPSFFRLQLGYALVFLSLIAPLLFTPDSPQEIALKRALHPVPSLSFAPSSAITKKINSFSLSETDLEMLGYSLAALMGLGMVLFAVDFAKLLYSRKSSYLLRQVGRAQIRVSKDEAIPSSFSIGRSSYVVVPVSLLADRQAVGHCIRHELQHIRQMDTFWIYIIVLIEKTLVINPFVRLLVTQIKSLQELACDEELVLNKKVTPQAYAGTLLHMLTLKTNGAGIRLAPSILGKTKKNELIRRINAMTTINTRAKIKTTFAMFFISTAIILGGARYSRAVEVRATSDQAVDFNLQIKENGNIISKPRIVSRMGEEALVVEGAKGHDSRYWKLRPTYRKSGNTESIVTDIEYGIKHEGVDIDEDYQTIAKGKIDTLVKQDGSPISGGPQPTSLKFEKYEIGFSAKIYEDKKAR